MTLKSFNNSTGEGIVAFEPWGSGSERDEDHARFYCHLLVAGRRVFEYGCPCGTCGITFRKVGSPAHRVSDAEAFRVLGNLETVPPVDTLLKLARILEPGAYYPVVLEGAVRLVEPGAADDYFASDVVRLFGFEPPDYEKPGSPTTSYYRLGEDHVLERSGRLGGPHKGLVTAVVMPLHSVSQLDRERIEYWKRQQRTGVCLTAIAVSVLDCQAPAMDPPDKSYPYREHVLLTNCLLDGHHRIQAAAELGSSVRILALLSQSYSLADTVDVTTVLRCYARQTRK